jgi:site-specific recombinase XerD
VTDSDGEFRRLAGIIKERWPTKYGNRLVVELRNYLNWLSQKDIASSNATLADIEDFLEHRGRRTTLPVQAIKLFHAHLKANGEASVDPTKDLKTSRWTSQRALHGGHEMRKWLDEAEASICAARTVRGLLMRARVWAMAELIYASGITTGELLRLQPANLDGSRPALAVGGRVVPITPCAVGAIATFRLLTGTCDPRPQHFIFSASESPDRPMIEAQVYNQFSALGREIGSPLNPRDIRFAFIREMVLGGMPVEHLAYIVDLKSASLRRHVGRSSAGSG